MRCRRLVPSVLLIILLVCSSLFCRSSLLAQGPQGRLRNSFFNPSAYAGVWLADNMEVEVEIVRTVNGPDDFKLLIKNMRNRGFQIYDFEMHSSEEFTEHLGAFKKTRKVHTFIFGMTETYFKEMMEEMQWQEQELIDIEFSLPERLGDVPLITAIWQPSPSSRNRDSTIVLLNQSWNILEKEETNRLCSGHHLRPYRAIDVEPYRGKNGKNTFAVICRRSGLRGSRLQYNMDWKDFIRDGKELAFNNTDTLIDYETFTVAGSEINIGLWKSGNKINWFLRPADSNTFDNVMRILAQGGNPLCQFHDRWPPAKRGFCSRPNAPSPLVVGAYRIGRPPRQRLVDIEILEHTDSFCAACIHGLVHNEPINVPPE